MKIQIILGSTRVGRVVPRIGKWVETAVNEIDGFEAEIIDLADFNIPFFNEPISPRYNPAREVDSDAKRFMDKLAEADGYVFVTPEYNHSITGVLKNALDYLDSQLNRKVSAIVSYGSVGGARAAEHLKGILLEAGTGVVPQAVAILGSPAELFDESGLLDSEVAANPYGPAGALRKTLTELAWWTEATVAARDKELAGV
jgi:NAD(P)H-dependent FMN reductase